MENFNESWAKKEILDFLNQRIAEYNSSASEMYLERDNPEGGDVLIAKLEAYKEILDFVISI